MDIEKIREDFPILKRKINGNKLVYLDSAATSQKPRQVIDTVVEYYQNHNANTMRGVHTLSEEATEMMENSRKKTKEFLNAKNNHEIVFTKNATEAINLVAYSWGEKNIKKGDKIVLSISEHHANLLPWQQLAIKKGAELVYLDIDNEGNLEEKWEKKINNSKLVAITHTSNVTGIINDVKNISKIAKEKGAVVIVDGSQSAPHMKIDVKKINCDFFVFTGHKMLAPMGTGALYGKEELLENMPPFMYGGGMNKKVEKENSEWNFLPYKFEAGTENVSGIIGLGSAMDYINRIGIDNIEKHGNKMIEYALERISEVRNVSVIGPKEYVKEKAPILSFNVEKVDCHDVAGALNEYGIAIRSGLHCAQPLHTRLGINSSARASLYLYNTEKEIDYFIDKLKTTF
ncbi:MAG: cysteine desulfurase [Candidatus ainarchaeum sp.]|nr:cysteine desulfurase [Candidatus ainarchaeum sp.]